MRIIINIVIGILIADLFCFILWALSGQQPEGTFYFGVITKSIISLFI
jgi:hypothetical protein